jgi:hypothetical protein
MGDDPRELARLLLLLAELHPTTAGPTARRAARYLLLLPPPPGVSQCPCGKPIEQPKRGRPRLYCSPGCRRRAEKSRGNANVQR